VENSFFIIGLGSSAGGQNALLEFFENLPPDPNAAFVVVTHLWRTHKTTLGDILSKATSLPISLIKNHQKIENNHIYVMPENVELQIKYGIAYTRPRKEEEIINRAIDTFFISLAEDQKEYAAGIIFSGCGSDGAKGVKRIHELNGKVFVQDPSSAAFNMMPIAAIEADHPDNIETPAALARDLVHYLAKKYSVIR
jgi:chemotaxis response regulator CheB